MLHSHAQKVKNLLLYCPLRSTHLCNYKQIIFHIMKGHKSYAQEKIIIRQIMLHSYK